MDSSPKPNQLEQQKLTEFWAALTAAAVAQTELWALEALFSA